MRTLTLNNGIVLENSYAIESTGMLFLYSQSGYNILELCGLLYPAENTRLITAEDEKVYAGYNKLVSVRDEENNMITAVLKKDGVE